VDLRHYSKQVELELQQIEQKSIRDCILQPHRHRAKMAAIGMGSWGPVMQVALKGMSSLSGFCHFGEDLGAGTADRQSSVFSVKPLTFVGQISKRVKT
jgi:hypothetical protein